MALFWRGSVWRAETGETHWILFSHAIKSWTWTKPSSLTVWELAAQFFHISSWRGEIKFRTERSSGTAQNWSRKCSTTWALVMGSSCVSLTPSFDSGLTFYFLLAKKMKLSWWPVMYSWWTVYIFSAGVKALDQNRSISHPQPSNCQLLCSLCPKCWS